MNDFVQSITQLRLPNDQYIDEIVDKDQIFLHHTASSSNPYGVLKWWAITPDRVGTAFIIAGKPDHTNRWKDGEIFQTFYSKKWAWHLGLKKSHLINGGRSSKDLNAMSIGIEICNWGWLTLEDDGRFHTYASTPDNPITIPENDVVELAIPYRGYKYWQRYTDAQLEKTRQLLVYLCETYNIDPKFKGIEIFNVNNRCLMGENGIWTHASCRPDKWDCFPQKELIQMLESL